MSANKCMAIIYKQIIDIKRNAIVLFLVFLYPALVFLFYFLLLDNPAINFVLPSFITLNVVMTPIITISSIISEEKEKGTLRILVMSNIKPMDYLLGIGLTLFIIIIITFLPYILILQLTPLHSLLYIIYCFFGVLISLVIGAIIGIMIKNQIGIGAVSSPISMFFGMLPMLTNFNTSIENVSKYFYSQQIYNFIKSSGNFEFNNFIIIIANLVAFVIIFLVLYKQKGME